MSQNLLTKYLISTCVPFPSHGSISHLLDIRKIYILSRDVYEYPCNFNILVSIAP